MSYMASVYKVMIASPSDVVHERQLIRDVLHEWNLVNSEDRGIALMPVSWETHSVPRMGERPQAVINRQVLRDCDLLVAAFWTRLGSPTGAAPSGTVEEIREHIATGRPTMLYFSSAPVHPDSVDDEQYRALKAFKGQCQEQGLIEEYDSLSIFREKFSRQLAMTVIRDLAGAQVGSSALVVAPPGPQLPPLSNEARELIREAAQDRHGTIMRIATMAGLQIQTNGRDFAERGNSRSEAKWDGVLRQLRQEGLVQDPGHKGELWELTDVGYNVADRLNSLL